MNSDAVSKAKQTRAEKKARKAMSKFGIFRLLNFSTYFGNKIMSDFLKLYIINLFHRIEDHHRSLKGDSAQVKEHSLCH